MDKGEVTDFGKLFKSNLAKGRSDKFNEDGLPLSDIPNRSSMAGKTPSRGSRKSISPIRYRKSPHVSKVCPNSSLIRVVNAEKSTLSAEPIDILVFILMAGGACIAWYLVPF
jgi:hypothetical protein